MSGFGRTAMALMPRHARNMRIGLLGGTFDPPHAGHRLASIIALQRLALDRVWWLVTPGNPLKHDGAPPPLDRRLAAARRVASHPRIDVTGIEAAIGTHYTFDTLSYLAARCAGVRFVWIMGGDNLLEFHRWHRWRDIAAMIPIVVIDRPGSTLRATHGHAAQTLARWRVDERDARDLVLRAPPALSILHGQRSNLSSTLLREGRLPPASEAACDELKLS